MEPFPSPPDRHGEHQHSIDSVEEPLSPTLEFPGLVGPTSWGLGEESQDDDEDVDLDLLGTTADANNNDEDHEVYLEEKIRDEDADDPLAIKDCD